MSIKVQMPESDTTKESYDAQPKSSTISDGVINISIFYGKVR